MKNNRILQQQIRNANGDVDLFFKARESETPEDLSSGTLRFGAGATFATPSVLLRQSGGKNARPNYNDSADGAEATVLDYNSDVKPTDLDFAQLAKAHHGIRGGTEAQAIELARRSTLYGHNLHIPGVKWEGDAGIVELLVLANLTASGVTPLQDGDWHSDRAEELRRYDIRAYSYDTAHPERNVFFAQNSSTGTPVFGATKGSPAVEFTLEELKDIPEDISVEEFKDMVGQGYFDELLPRM